MPLPDSVLTAPVLFSQKATGGPCTASVDTSSPRANRGWVRRRPVSRNLRTVNVPASSASTRARFKSRSCSRPLDRRVAERPHGLPAAGSVFDDRKVQDHRPHEGPRPDVVASRAASARRPSRRHVEQFARRARLLPSAVIVAGASAVTATVAAGIRSLSNDAYSHGSPRIVIVGGAASGAPHARRASSVAPEVIGASSSNLQAAAAGEQENERLLHTFKGIPQRSVCSGTSGANGHVARSRR